jgi:hypothetical protein
MRILTSAVLYFAVVYPVPFLIGPIRAAWLEPRLGHAISLLCEALVLLIAMALAAKWIPKKLALDTNQRSLLTMGVGALALRQVVDFIVGISLRGNTPGEQLAYLASPAGSVYLAAIAVFAIMPVVVNFRTGGR